MSGRSQLVIWNGPKSGPHPLTHGGAQGSVQGPLLFLVMVATCRLVVFSVSHTLKYLIMEETRKRTTKSSWVSSALDCSVCRWCCTQFQHCCQIQNCVNDPNIDVSDKFLVVYKVLDPATLLKLYSTNYECFSLKLNYVNQKKKRLRSPLPCKTIITLTKRTVSVTFKVKVTPYSWPFGTLFTIFIIWTPCFHTFSIYVITFCFRLVWNAQS